MSRIFLLAIATVALAAAQSSTPPPLSCGVGEVYDACPNSCYEPVCGDNEMELCAGIIKCDAPKCVCNRAKGYARDTISSGKCVKRANCPNPCITVKCSAGKVCQAKDGKGVCVDASVDTYPVTLNACAATLCQVGSICVEEGGVAKCVAPPTTSPNNCTKVSFEEWRSCASCEPSCENKTPFCNKMCQPGRCMCRQGFFRSKDGQCVTENECDIAATSSPLKCTRANEEYRECASACEPSCKNKDKEMACIAMCKPPACQCKNGYYRNDKGDCVEKDQCGASSPQCKSTETFAECSSMCEPQCGQYKPMACIMMCGPPKCQCNSGLYRNFKGECVTRAECEKNPAPSTPAPPTCKKNQEFQECSTVCEQKCGEYEVRPCMAMCGPPKCQCKRGFYLDNQGECVSRAECDAQAGTPKTPSQADCKPNELFRTCSSRCEAKCGQYEPIACIEICDPPKCQCQDKFYRNSVGDCVSRSDCENDQPITCANIDCVSGMICKMDNGKPTCVKGEALTCNTVKCAGGHRCEIKPDETPECIPEGPRITCANVRCAGPCTDTPTGPRCGPRPQVLPISVGPTEAPVMCANMRCSGPCRDTPTGGVCAQVLPISVGPTPTPGCPVNEEIRSCTNKCNEQFCGDEHFARRCAQVCLTPECECKEGFVRDGKKGCVKREDCSKKQEGGDEACGLNEERKPCGNPCMEPFCGNELVDLNCPITTDCKPSGCECKEGFVRDRSTKRCIRREECPSRLSPCARKNCGINGRCIEEYGQAKCVPLFPRNQKMAAFVAPPPTAADAIENSPHRYPSLPDSCDKVTCLGGGTCVMEEVKCISGPCKPVPKCKGGSSAVAPTVAAAYNPANDPAAGGYGSVYQPYAENCGQLNCKFGEECTMERVPCFAHPCKKMAVCRPRNTVCHKAHEVWDQCFHDCGPTCQNRDAVCTEICGPGGCICDTFYIRNEFTGECVRLDDCPLPGEIPIEKPRILEPPLASYDSPVSSSAGGPPPPPPPTCENFDCPIGQMCTLPPMLCPVPPCTRRPTCVKDPNFLPGDEIVPTCEGQECPDGEKCQLQEVQCIRAPCYPQPTCVPDVSPPCVLPCPLGETCVLETVICKKAPCPPQPTCRPESQTCAAVTCVFGETCVEEPLPCLVAPCPTRASCKPPNKTCEKKNEVWDQCFHGCEATCQTRMKACTLQCGPGGCQCDSGYIRDEISGECVLEKDCPAACADDEQYDKCFHGCEPTCIEGAPFCTKECGPGGCRCADGLVRDEATRKCIPYSACSRGTGY